MCGREGGLCLEQWESVMEVRGWAVGRAMVTEKGSGIQASQERVSYALTFAIATGACQNGPSANTGWPQIPIEYFVVKKFLPPLIHSHFILKLTALIPQRTSTGRTCATETRYFIVIVMLIL